MGCSGSKAAAKPPATSATSEPPAKPAADDAATSLPAGQPEAGGVIEKAEKAAEKVLEAVGQAVEQAVDALKPQDEHKAEDTETVTTLPKEDSPLFGRDVKVEGDAPAGACTCAGLW